jgi:hypothetical protein
MAEHDLQTVALARRDQAQLAALKRCPLMKLRRLKDGNGRHPRAGCVRTASGRPSTTPEVDERAWLRRAR